jgi:preprotein translocase subunit SecA
MVRERVTELGLAAWKDREASIGVDLMRQFERSVMLQTLDHQWREHLASLDHLRQGIHLRGYAQKNPKQEYKREAFELFSDMLDRIKQDVVKYVLTVSVRSEQDVQAVEAPEAVSNVKYQHANYEEALAATAADGDVAIAPPPPFTRAGEKVGRNDPCPCGSGKKYKHCHGRF